MWVILLTSIQSLIMCSILYLDLEVYLIMSVVELFVESLSILTAIGFK